jgi:hypothetical protein
MSIRLNGQRPKLSMRQDSIRRSDWTADQSTGTQMSYHFEQQRVRQSAHEHQLVVEHLVDLCIAHIVRARPAKTQEREGGIGSGEKTQEPRATRGGNTASERRRRCKKETTHAPRLGKQVAAREKHNTRTAMRDRTLLSKQASMSLPEDQHERQPHHKRQGSAQFTRKNSGERRIPWRSPQVEKLSDAAHRQSPVPAE